MFKYIALFLVVLIQSSWVSALQDPTKPLRYKSKTLTANYNLQSILMSSERKRAVINGQQLQENQLIYNSGGVKVIKIEPYRVLLQQGEKRWALTLRESALVKKTAAKQ